jgi:hypothetical protein
MSTLLRFSHGFALAGALAGLGCQGLQGTPPLALGQMGISGLASDGNSVYWTTASGDVRSVPTVGGTVQQVTTTVSPANINLDADSVYWASGTGEIQRAPKTGGSPEVLVHNANGLGALQVDESSLYWMIGGGEAAVSGQILKAAKAPAASPTALVTSATLYANTLAQVGATLYYYDPLTGSTTPGGVREVDVTEGSPVTDVPGSFSQVATATSTVCSAGPDPQARALDPNATAQAVTCAALDGSNPRVVASGLTAVVTSMALDDTTVYFATADGAVSSVAADGSNPMVGSGSTSTASPPGDCIANAGCSCPGSATGVQMCDALGNTTCQCSGASTFAMSPASLGGAYLAIDPTNVYWAQPNGDAVFALPRN